MAFENLIIRTKRDINGIPIDGILSEGTNLEVRVTTNPIEDGADIVDHIIKVPVTIVIDGVITDTPLGLAGFNNVAKAIGGAFDSITGIFGSSSEGKALTRSQQVYKELVSLLNSHELITVQTKLKQYENLVFQSISVQQDKDTSRAVFFTASFIEIFIVESAQAAIIDYDNITDKEAANSYSDFENNGDWELAEPKISTEERILSGGQV